MGGASSIALKQSHHSPVPFMGLLRRPPPPRNDMVGAPPSVTHYRGLHIALAERPRGPYNNAFQRWFVCRENAPMPVEPIATNKKAHFLYYLLERFEAGIELKGTEVKSLRERKVSLNESYARVVDGEVFLLDMNVSPYEPASRNNHPPKRARKLLLHKREIKRIAGKTSERGLTIVPVSLYFKEGIAKVEIAIAKGKSKYDKREDLKEREDKRSITREMRRRR